MHFVLLYHAWNNPHETKGVIFARTHTSQLLVSTDTLYRSKSRGRLTENERASRLYTPSRGDATFCCYYATRSSKL